MIDIGCPPPRPPAIIVRQATPNPAVKRPVLRVQAPARPVKPRPRLRTTACSLPVVPAGLPSLPPGMAGLVAAAEPLQLPAGPGEPELNFEAPGAGPAEARSFAVASAGPESFSTALLPPAPLPSWAGPGVQLPAPLPPFPEPGTWALLLAGVALLLLKARRP